MVSHWSLSDSKSHQVSRTLFSILAGLNNAVVWMVSTCPLISNPSSSFTNPLGIVPGEPTTVGITVNFMFHIFSSLARSMYLSPFTLLFTFTLLSVGRQTPLFGGLSFFLFFFFFWITISRSGHWLVLY